MRAQAQAFAGEGRGSHRATRALPSGPLSGSARERREFIAF